MRTPLMKWRGVILGVILSLPFWAVVLTLIIVLSGCSANDTAVISAHTAPQPDPSAMIWQLGDDGVMRPYIRVGNEMRYIAPGERVGGSDPDWY